MTPKRAHRARLVSLALMSVLLVWASLACARP
jgi:hypothetical protein